MTFSTIKNLALVFTIAIIIPTMIGLYINYFYPFQEYWSLEMPEISELEKELNILREQKNIDLILFEKGKIEADKINALQKNIITFEDNIKQKRQQIRNEWEEKNKIHKTKVFITIMIITFIFILLGIFSSYSILNASFISGSSLLLIYGYIHTWSGVTTLLKLISLTIWFILLISLMIFTQNKQSLKTYE